jgi:hypothetical protein
MNHATSINAKRGASLLLGVLTLMAKFYRAMILTI